MHRRQFLRATGTAFAALFAAGCAARGTAGKTTTRLSTQVAPLLEDPKGLLDLPPGFTYEVLSHLGDLMDDGEAVPDKADGMGCFDLGDGRLALVRNHELIPPDTAGGPLTSGFGRLHGQVLPGGTTHLVVDADTLAVRRQFRSLAGTVRNCAGGSTPWGSWLTCEEAPVTPRDKGAEGLSKSHGWVFEIPADADGLVDAEPLTGLGRFNHEAACIDPDTGVVYLTEDRDDSVLYRFVPSTPGRLHAGGRLQAMKVVGMPDSRNWVEPRVAERRVWPVQWLDLEDVQSPNDDLRRQAADQGATKIARGEGIHMGEGEAYLCATSGGAAKLGQVFRLRPSRDGMNDQFELFFESRSRSELNFGDNLTVAPNGHLIVCEDQYAEPIENHLIGLTPDGVSYRLARMRLKTELAGACFSPDGQTLFVNAYSPTRTLAIRGPWETLSSA